MDAQKPMKLKVSITLDDDVIDTIKNYAERDDRSFSQYINMVLKGHIKRVKSANAKKPKK